MKTILHILMIIPYSLYSQSESTLRKVFLGLNPSNTREVNYHFIKSDNRFFQDANLLDTTERKLWSYYGKTIDNGVVKGRTDSTIIELTFVTQFDNDTFRPLLETTILRIEYYFSSSVTMELEYQRLLTLLKTTTKRIRSPYDDMTCEIGVGVGTLFTYGQLKNENQISVVKISLSENSYVLKVEFRRPGN